MILEDYFDFHSEIDIRLKGSRFGIDTILTDYLSLGLYAEEIANRYPTITIEQVYATLTYYWRNKEAMDAYLVRVDEEYERQRRDQDMNPSPGIQRLRELARQRHEAKRHAAPAR
jgi:uncharacterized protein (DUF433 family)